VASGGGLPQTKSAEWAQYLTCGKIFNVYGDIDELGLELPGCFRPPDALGYTNRRRSRRQAIPVLIERYQGLVGLARPAPVRQPAFGLAAAALVYEITEASPGSVWYADKRIMPAIVSEGGAFLRNS